MARIRYLKPDFFKDEDLAILPLVARMTFEGLWCHADREGRLEYRPRYLKAEVWPYDDVDMEAVLKQLAAPEVPGRPDKVFIIIYEIGNRKFIQIKEFLKHQKPHHTERHSIIPPSNGVLTVKQTFPDGKSQEGMGMGMGMEKGMESVEPAVSTPESDPYALIIELFWNTYPHRNGNKIGKQETLDAIKKYVLPEECPLLIQATKNFAENPDAKKGIGVKDPQRFVACGPGKKKSQPWREWVKPEKVQSPPTSTGALSRLCEDEERIRKERENGNHVHATA